MERLKSSIISQETETDKALTPEKILAKTTPRQDDDKKVKKTPSFIKFSSSTSKKSMKESNLCH